MFVLIQLTLILFFAPLAAATAVAHEKDRRTFVLLLMTDLSDLEIVLGKLTASLLQIGTLLAVAAPVFFLCMLLGGVGAGQILDVLGVTAAAGLAGGALGLVVALWRDRTFQSLALTVLLVVLALIGVEAVGLRLPRPAAPRRAPGRGARPVPGGPRRDLPGRHRRGAAAEPGLHAGLAGRRRGADRPGRRPAPGLEPRPQRAPGAARGGAGRRGRRDAGRGRRGARAGAVAVAADGAGAGAETKRPDPIQPPRRAARPLAEATGLHVPRRTHRRVVRAARPYRRPWSNPILWRELRTRAYGTKPLIIKGAYVLAFALGVAIFRSLAAGWNIRCGPAWR